MLKRSIHFFIFLLIILSIWACSDHNAAIYYSIEREKPLNPNASTKGMTINGMDKNGNRTYIAAGTSIFTRENDDAGWVTVEKPSGAEAATGLVFFEVGSTRLYVGCENGLYYTTDITGTTTPNWIQVFSGNVVRMKIASNTNTLFVSKSASGGKSNTLYYVSNIDGSYGIVTNLENLDSTIEDVAWDGTNFLAVAGNTVYRSSSSGDPKSMTAVATPGTSGTLFGIIHTSNYYYVADNNGQIFYTATLGNSWSNQSFAFSGKNVQFRHFAQLPNNGLILLGGYTYGTFGAGYFFSEDNANPNFKRVDVTVQQLYYSPVYDFFIDTATATVYTLNDGTGIWKNAYNAATGLITDHTQWVQE